MTKRKQGTTEIQPYTDLLEKRSEPFDGNVQVDFIFRHRVLRHTVKESCEQLGISLNYGYQMNQKWDKDPKFRARIFKRLDAYPEDYKSACKSLLPSILKTEVKGLQAMSDNPELAVKHPQLLKHLKQAGGIDLNETPKQPPQIVNIGAIGQLVLQSLEGEAGDIGELKELITEADVVEVDKIEGEKGADEKS